MAPTVEDLGQYLTEKIETNPTSRLWSYNTLVDSARRWFGSTTPAIKSRMKTLIGEGELVAVRVDCSGLVYWSDPKMETGYFVPEVQYGYPVLDHGTVTWKRPKDREHLWVSGVQNFYTTPKHMEELRVIFSEEKTRRREATKARWKAEELAFGDAVKETADDGLKLLRSLRDALPESNMSTDMSTINDSYDDKTPHPRVSLHVDYRDLATFLSILRPGVVLKDFAEQNVVQ